MIVDNPTNIRFKYLPNETAIVSHYNTNMFSDIALKTCTVHVAEASFDLTVHKIKFE